MEFNNCKVFNIEGALRGMRNPKNSWNLSDSYFGLENIAYDDASLNEVAANWVDYDGIDYESDDYSRYYDQYSDWLINNGI